MVDVGAKEQTERMARAEAVVEMSPATVRLLRKNALPKGSAVEVARIAGIQAAKKTAELLPLCHPLTLDAVTLEFAVEADAIRATASASLTGKTGVEMEAITAACVALLTIYDMAKAVDKGMVIEEVRLIEKRGGKSGTWRVTP